MEEMLYQILPVAIFVNAALFAFSVRGVFAPQKVREDGKNL